MEGGGPGAGNPGSPPLSSLERARTFPLRAYLVSISVLAALVRFLPWKASIAKNHVLFIQPDAYYHLRRATIITKNFPLYPTIDTYMAYPFGAEPPWPPLYDFAIAVLSLIAGLGNPSERTLMLVTAFLPPVLAGLTVVPVFLLARELFGRRVAIVAAFFAVMMPGQLSYSAVGSGDHHVAELLFFTLYVYLLLKSLRFSGAILPRDPDGDETHREAGEAGGPDRSALLSGVCLAAATLVWQGSMVFATLGTAYLGILLVREGEAAVRRATLRAGLLSLLCAAAIVAAGRAAIPPATEQTVFGFGFFSWFQPFYLAVLGIALAALAAFSDAVRRKGWTPAQAAGGAGVLVLFLAGAAVLVPPLRRNLVAAAEFVLRKHPYLQSINEFQPLIDRFPWRGVLDLPFLFDALYLLGFLIPLLICGRILWKARGRGIGDRELFFLLWSALFGFLTMEQKRWSNVYSANMAVGIGVFVVSVLDRTRIGQKALSDFLDWRLETGRTEKYGGAFSRIVAYSRRFPKVFTGILVVVLFIPYYLTVLAMATPREIVMNPDFYNSFVWIRLNTPPTVSPWKPTEKPEYAILASWDLGHYLQFISERPTVANNFGYQLRGEGLEDSVRMYLYDDEKEVLDLCDRRGVKFLLLSDVFGGMDTMAPIVGVDFVKEFTEPVTPPGHPWGGFRIPSPRYYALPYMRMYAFDGSATPDAKAIERFRLVFESKNGSGADHLPPGTKYVKLFEKVAGARIAGKATPGLPVTVSVRMLSNFDRPFDYLALTTADRKGNFKVTVPYASAGTTYPVRAASFYLALTEKEAVFFQVEEKDVVEGREVRIDLRKGGLPAGKHPAVKVSPGHGAPEATGGEG